MLAALFLCLLRLQAEAADTKRVGINAYGSDRTGRIRVYEPAGNILLIGTDLRIFPPGWSPMLSLDNAVSLTHQYRTEGEIWESSIRAQDQQSSFVYHQTARIEDGRLHLSCLLTALADIPLEGAYFWIELPAQRFAGSQAVLTCPEGRTRDVMLAAEVSADAHLLANAAATTITLHEGGLELAIDLDKQRTVQIQDDRRWNVPAFGILIPLHEGELRQGQSVTLTLAMEITRIPDEQPVHLELTPAERYRLQGFGGNYCFFYDKPHIEYTLDNLRVAWARTDMLLEQWEPENDNSNPELPDWEALRRQDRAGSDLRARFKLMQDLAARQIPFCVSVWYLPGWMYENPGADRNQIGRRVAASQWDEIVESVVTYLLYAKQYYAAEPALFSFNEPDLGVYVKLSPQEHVDAIIRFGEAFRAAGLRTRPLLGDVASARGTTGYVAPALSSAKARAEAGAVAFHTWNGARPVDYAAWSQMAQQLNLPLLVTEVGVDPAAYRTGRYRQWSYALQELELYQELLLHAQPQAVLQWQYTDDYSLFEPMQEDRAALTPTARFGFVQHFSQLTPADAQALETKSSNTRVLFTAFRGAHNGNQRLTLHIANLGPGRMARISGLPANVRLLNRQITDRTAVCAADAAVPVSNSAAELWLPAESLTSLWSDVAATAPPKTGQPPTVSNN